MKNTYVKNRVKDVFYTSKMFLTQSEGKYFVVKEIQTLKTMIYGTKAAHRYI